MSNNSIPPSNKSVRESNARGSVLFMNALSEASFLLRQASGVRGPDDSVKAMIGRAARRCGLSFNRARDLWYAHPRCVVRAEEIDALRECALAKEITHDRDARAAILSRLADLEARLAVVALGAGDGF